MNDNMVSNTDVAPIDHYWLENYRNNLTKACMKSNKLEAFRQLTKICEILDAKGTSERRTLAQSIIRSLNKLLEKTRNKKRREIILQILKFLKRRYCS